MFKCAYCPAIFTKPYGKWSSCMTCSEKCNEEHIASLRKALHEREASEAARVATKQPAFQVGHDSEGTY